MTIGILGGGVWGSALARVLSNNKVIIYARDEKIVKSINEHKINPKLKYSSFNENVTATTSLKEIRNVKFLFITLPAQNIREVIKDSSLHNKNHHIIICSKGIEISSSKFLTDVFQEMMPFKSISILSGPSFSNEYAIAAGVSEGLNLGENAKSALISRSFAEMTRYANKFKADKNTLFGLSGLGDLILTCSSKNSRNTQFGIKLASSKYDNFLDLLKSQEVTEGYYTVKAVYNISQNKNIDMPIMESVYNILYKQHDLKEELSNLLSRPITEEKI